MHRPTKSPATMPLVNGAKIEQTKRILTHAAHALCATFLSVHPIVYGSLMAYIVWGVRHGF